MIIKTMPLTPKHLIKDMALRTINKPPTGQMKDSWYADMLRAEHSPIRSYIWLVDMMEIPSWVSVHFVRHKINVEHFVTTQRTDRVKSDTPRDKKLQGELVNHSMILNAEALINMSHKRLCAKASLETRNVMYAIKESILHQDKILWANLVPRCVYLGRCKEFAPCGLLETELYKEMHQQYFSAGD